MILAAGRGRRMGALTDQTPKPLLKVRGRRLIEYAIASLTEAGVRDIVINISWHADQIREALGNGERYGAKFHYSYEPDALETGGGILKALPLLGGAPFAVISADIILEHSLRDMQNRATGKAHILLVPNPDFHTRGDFSLEGNRVTPRQETTVTYANAGIFSPDFFRDCKPGRFPLGPLLHEAVAQGEVSGEMCRGRWWNVGTAELLQAAERDMTGHFFKPCEISQE